jgi:hypothetical protein
MKKQILYTLCDCLSLNDDRQDLTPPRLSEADWIATIQLANNHLLGPAYYASLRRRGWLAYLGEDAQDYLIMLYRMNQRRNLVMRRQAEQTIRALNLAGIVPTLLKGSIVLFESSGPTRYWSLRMMRDLDLLVARDAASLATSALKSIGYDIVNKYPDDHHAIADFGRPTDPGSVDLHAELIDPWYILPAAEVRDRALALRHPDVQALVPSPTHRVLHHLLHAQIHHLGQFYLGELKLNQLYEFAVICKHSGGSIDWPLVTGRLSEYGLETMLHSYLAAAQRLFGLSCPPNVIPGAAGRHHFRWCLLQLGHPQLGRSMAPWGNLCGSLAVHRMRALYGHTRSLPLSRVRHAWRFWTHHSIDELLARMFRTE